jgi:hypothetical protein
VPADVRILFEPSWEPRAPDAPPSTWYRTYLAREAPVATATDIAATSTEDEPRVTIHLNTDATSQSMRARLVVTLAPDAASRYQVLAAKAPYARVAAVVHGLVRDVWPLRERPASPVRVDLKAPTDAEQVREVRALAEALAPRASLLGPRP